MAWEVFSNARAYAKWAKYEYNTPWLLSVKNRNLHKKLKGYERTQTLFIYFVDKHGKKRLLEDVLKIDYRR